MTLIEEMARAMFVSIPEGHWFREHLSAEPLSIMSKAALAVILKRLREPSEELLEAAADGYHESKEEKRKAYDSRHQYRRDRGDDVPPFSACPADWLPGTLRAIADHLEQDK